MGFVDEQDDRDRGRFDLLDHVLEAILELALHASARLQQRQIERSNHHVLERRRHVAFDDRERKTLGYSRLPHTGLAGQDRVVLATAREDVDDLANLGIPPEHGVDLAVARGLRQVDGELVERRRRATGLGLGARLGRRQLDRGLTFDGVRGQRLELGLNRVGGQGQERLGGVAHLPRERIGRQQGAQQVTASNATGLRGQGRDQPRLFRQVHDRGSQGRRPRVARLEAVQRALQLGHDHRRILIEPADHGFQVGARRLEDLQQPVLDLDVVVRARETESGSAFEGSLRNIVEAIHEGLQVHGCHGERARRARFEGGS